MKRLAALLALAAFFTLVTWSSAQQPPKHPGTKSDCAALLRQTETCTQWVLDVSFGTMHGYEMWSESETLHSPKVTNNYHRLALWNDKTKEKRTALFGTTVTEQDGVTSLIRWLEWTDGPGPEYKEACTHNETAHGITEHHSFTTEVGNKTTYGFSVNYGDGEVTTKYRENEHGLLEKDDSVVDITRCKDKGFPFSIVREPRIKQPG
jgi:hypothetical protein